MSSTTAKEDNYPGERTIVETSRLHTQHNLVVAALDGLILCPADLSRPSLRFLDVGTADGYFLSQLRSQLPHPDSTTLVGTDIAPYPDPAVPITIHNFKTPFPDDWKESFDFVQMPACLANSPGDEAVGLIRRLLELVKPGGWLQLVDGTMQTGALLETDRPSMKLFKIMGNFLSSLGMDACQGPRVAELLREAGGEIVDGDSAGAKSAAVRIGKGAERGLETEGWNWIRGTFAVLGNALSKVENPLLAVEDLKKFKLDVLEEAEKEGFDLMWYAAWARKT